MDNDPSHIEIFEVGLDYEKVSDAERDTPLHESTPWPEAGEEGVKFRELMEGQYKLRH